MSIWSNNHPPKTTLLALDHAGNTLWWNRQDGWGRPDETVSARSGRLRDVSTLGAMLAWLLDHIQTDHTSEAIDNDEVRAETVREAEQEAGEAMADAVDAEIREQRDGKRG